MKLLCGTIGAVLIIAGAVWANEPLPFDSGLPSDMLLAQRPGEPPMGGPGGPRFPGERQMRHMEQFRLLKLLEFLDLNEDQETEFIVGYRKMRKEERQTDMNRREVADRLAESIRKGKLEERAVVAQVDSIRALREEAWRVHNDFLTRAKSILTTEQWAKLIIFHERFEQEMLEQVRGFRDRETRDRYRLEKRAKDSLDEEN